MYTMAVLSVYYYSGLALEADSKLSLADPCQNL